VAATTQAPPDSTRGRDLDAGRLLAGLGALALLISLFVDWYGQSEAFGAAGGGPDVGITAWTAFELVDILLAALAATTLAWVIEGIVRSGRPTLPETLGTVVGPIAFTLVLISIINEPPTLSPFDPSREVGAWIALAGAALMTIGALLRIARISLVVSPRDRVKVVIAGGARESSLYMARALALGETPSFDVVQQGAALERRQPDVRHQFGCDGAPRPGWPGIGRGHLQQKQ